MSESTPPRFDELLSRYLDATLSDAEENELLGYLSDETLAARFHEAKQLDTEIAGVLAGSVPDEVMVNLVWSDLGRSNVPSPVSVHKMSRSLSPLLLALAAMIVFLLVFSATRLLRAPVADTPDASSLAQRGTVSSIRGEVYLVRSTGREPLVADKSLISGGTIQTVGQASRATLFLADGTEITLKGDTTFTAGLEPGERKLFLQEGMFVANVMKQSPSVPLIFSTAQAKATVRGTELAMIEAKSETYLAVTEGSVALQRSAGGSEVVVDAGFYAHVESDGPFHSFPIGRMPKALREQLSEQ